MAGTKYEAGPSIIVQDKKGNFLYVYKGKDGKCWFEQANIGSEQDDDENNDLNNIDKNKTLEHTMKDDVDETQFMEEHLDYIIDPDDTVKRYLSNKWLLKVYLCVCFFAELCLILGITIKYKGSIT